MKIRSKVLLSIVLTAIGSVWLACDRDSSPKGGAPAPAPQPAQPSPVTHAQPENAGTTVAVSVPENTNEYSPSSDTNESAACRKNLEKIHAAIEAYEKDHHDVPNWLSDLVPKYLADTNVLICPVTRRTGRQSAIGVLDPKIYSSYVYEFAPVLIPRNADNNPEARNVTMRDWKKNQVKLVGPVVPLVRCLLHDPTLNLSVGGKIYESQLMWELKFTNTAKIEDFFPK